MQRRTVAVVLSVLALAAVPACAPGGAERPAPALAARAEVLRQTPVEIARTTAGLRRLDDLPMYEMTYHGGYDAEAPLTDAELARPADGWACSLFHRDGEFGRNFDWDPNPAMVVHARPPGGHASVSLADVSYLFEPGHGAPDLDDPQDRRRLAHAVLAPFDGMNDQGLAVGLAAAPDAELPARRPGHVTVGGLRIIRLVLDRAATVPEAIELMRRYDLDFTGGPQLHYLIADRAGRSAVVEYGEGRMNVVDDRHLTNIALTGADRATKLADRRYRLLAEGGRTEAMELLRKVAQPHTRWSVVYDLDDGTGRLVTGQRWDRIHTIRLADATS
ncbi:Linear amide C-N hydrolases, choloylglycine hydrolase family [Nonomuraea maritima]|uniref:Linear amide C-N hydrolases, choloylglycine hydrolase family n=1 Tax=Nonomuraea maritima TaxID=683260 RepID=A0A1G9CKL0_9ACTN|nr:linear amide C-N hydrolase [Nonomuraea maritima]SDK52126.1 Linear amide C-N hydrolases, choloylglycine hydrolase family [Nonomuraea maritima]